MTCVLHARTPVRSVTDVRLQRTQRSALVVSKLRPHCARRSSRLRAVPEEQQNSTLAETTAPAPLNSNLSFVLRLFAVSLGGAALVKYGSLAVPLPFYPNPIIATAMVVLPPSIFALVYSQK